MHTNKAPINKGKHLCMIAQVASIPCASHEVPTSEQGPSLLLMLYSYAIGVSLSQITCLHPFAVPTDVSTPGHPRRRGYIFELNQV